MMTVGRAVAVLCFLSAVSITARAAQLVDDSVPRDGDRVTFRVPISAHFGDPIELDSDGDGAFTRVDSASVEGGSADIAIAVNDLSAPNRVILEQDTDGDPGTPGGAPVPGTATWDLRDYPPMLRIAPDEPLERDALYRLVVFDGATPEDPAARRAGDGEPAEPFELTFHTLPVGALGEVRKETFVPPSLGYEEVYNIYLPAGWGASATQLYPAIYMLHGGFGNEDTWRDTVRSVVDRLVDEGEIEPVIAVMPDGNSGPCPFPFFQEHRLFSNTWDGEYLYGDYTAYDLPAEVESRFRVEGARWRRAVAGMSMGGFGSASVGLGHPEEFGFVAPLAGWQHSVRMVTPPGFPDCLSTHWEVIPDLGDGCPGGAALQDAIGPVGSSDLAHMKTVNGRDLALATTDDVFRGNIFLAHGVTDETATVDWSDDISCALEETGAGHCYKRREGVGHTGELWNVAFEEDVLPRFHALAYWADLPPGIDVDCGNATVGGLVDTDRDGVADDGDRSGTIGDNPCRGAAEGCDDNCRDAPNPDQADLDADGAGDPCDADDDGDGLADAADCDPLDAQAGTPPEAGPLSLTREQAATTISWPDQPTADRYDLSRGSASALGASGDYGSCLAEDLAEPSYTDAEVPPPGDGFVYLVRGEDLACGGHGPWGSATDGTPRAPTGCTP
jgi:S-formylglutathione hydrolase FrmB